MENDKYEEHPLDAWLDAESEEEFGEPEIRDRFDPAADANVDGNLKNWTAQDFASIYVRFRPHLERHARRYLSNPAQAEEVVQDAFLYLMTSLPELDSELGVLKFLKWKIRLLSLDVIRASSTKREIPVPEHVEYASEDQELVADLERAEDSAVIQMALAKLNPRQREALLASVYEEKTSDEVASQLGLSPNAARQLIFRAKSSFKKALIGEAEVRGKSVGQLLSIAAKKAAHEARENAAKVGAFIVLIAVGIGVVPALVPDGETIVANAPSTETQEPNEVLESSDVNPPIRQQSSNTPPSEENTAEELPAEAEEPPAPITEDESTDEISPVAAELTSAVEVTEEEDSFLMPQNFNTVLATNSNSAFYYQNSKPDIFQAFDGESIQIFAGTGVSAFLDYRAEELTIYNAILQLRVQDELVFAIPTEFNKSTLYDGTNFDLVFEGNNFYIVRADGTVISDSVMSVAKSRAVVKLDTDGEIVATSLTVSR